MASVGSSTSSSSLSSLSAKTGIGGLVSGMDIDELVESLSATSRQKILKQQQNLQKLEWKQSSYRSITSKLKEFQSKYLDVLSKTNFRSTSFFNTVQATSSSDAVTVSSTGSASEGTIKIGSITQLATNQTVKATESASKALTSSKTVASFIAGLQAGESISLNLDGKVKTITFDSDFVTAVTTTPANFETEFQSLIDEAYGTSGVIDVSVGIVGAADEGLVTLNAIGSKLTLNTIGTGSTTLGDLGFTSGQSNKLTTTTSLGDLTFATELDAVGNYSFKINNTNFTFNNTDTLNTIMEKINSSDAGVTISYSSITDKFTMTADESGSGDNIVISQTSGNLMTVFGLTEAANADVDYGVNAILSVNGVDIIRSSNTFEVDGVKVTLKNTSASEISLTMTENATSLLDSIKGFVEDYNKMIDLVNGLTKEDVDKDFQPLTDEQRDEMSETEIATWEKKAKSGILKNDATLKGISSKLHTVMTGLSVGGISLYSMGITSAGYGENGKLQIDEAKLKTALETKGNEIKELFTSENGIGGKLNDIITGATKTSGVKGSRGTLVELAGVDSTLSDTENSIFEQMKKINKNITTLQNRLEDEETRLWRKFTAMETAINNLNSQSSVLSQFSSNA
ncbi:MAG TPA: flagellar filament capping protein FliD [Anaerovoracaceae bacterium]|nr:flagellar filament capping protein FliD [Anaerovoracaceae bacterium]